ncbi:MAG: hypothetical protein JWN99_1828 [Ilumatobacteraceae bacterium]|nr:hypothetical protein [Ilumatobacteraceae bacterium]
MTVLDPACGDGAFLAGVRRALGPSVRLMGVDIDADAVTSARDALPDADIVHADALSMEWGERIFDVVIGNPPFLNQLSAATTRGGRSRFGGGPYADAAAEFLALSSSLTRPGGRFGMVLPQSILSTRDAAPIRAAVLQQAALRHAWWSPTAMFDATVRTCALVFERAGESAAVSRSYGPSFTPVPDVVAPSGASWSSLLAAPDQRPPAGDGPVLGDIASFAVDFRDQYYGLIGAVSDDSHGPPLITSGLIDPGRCRWGERPVRFAKQRFAAPRVDLDRLTPKLQRWAQTRLVPKILIANQTTVIEAVVDREGAWLPSVPVITCTSPDLDRVMDALSSPDAIAWVRHQAAGSGLSAHTVRLSPTLLATIPLPT